MANELQDKVVLVTSGAGLLGKAFVSCIVQYGGTSNIADISEKNGHEFLHEIEHEVVQGYAKFDNLDITSSESIESAIKLHVFDHALSVLHCHDVPPLKE